MKESNSTKGSSNSKNKEVKTSLFNEVRGEYRKIIWPSRKEQIKQTKIVIIVSLVLGAVIVSYDFIFGVLIDALTKLFI